MAWTQRGSVLVAADAASHSFPDYGYRTATSSNGLAMAVVSHFWSTSNGTAGVYTYDWSGSAWDARGSVLSVDTTSGSAFNFINYGSFVSLNSDGSVMAVGASNDPPNTSDDYGAVYVYDRSGSAWAQRGSVITPGTRVTGNKFGWSGALSGDGLVLYVGCGNAAKVYRFTWSGSVWVESGVVLAEWADGALATNNDGSTVAVSSTGFSFKVFDWTGSAYTQKGSTVSSSTGSFGSSIAMSSDATKVFVGAHTRVGSTANQGAVWPYTWTGSAWAVGAVILAPDASNDQFGFVSCDSAGAILNVGAIRWEGATTDQGGIYTFDYTPDPSGTGTVSYAPSVTGYGGIPNVGSGSVQYSPSTSGTGGFYLVTTTIDEAAVASDTPAGAGTYYLAVREGLQATTSAALQAAYHQTLSETALGQVVIDANKHFEALITEAITGNVGAALALGSQLVELGLSADSSATLRQLAVDVAEIIVALSSLAQGTTYDVVESAAVNDSVAPLVTALALLIESAAAADATTPALTLMAVVEESFTAADTPAALLAALTVITEAIDAGVLLRLGDDYYVGWVLNPEGVMTRSGPQPTVSQYQNYPFNSLAALGGRYYAAGSDGIYELTGSDDAGTPIVGYLKSGKLDFGSSQQKRLDSAYFAVATDGVVRLKVITHDRGENVETWYQVVSHDDGAVAENIRVQVGKGLKSRYWQFELVVEDATSFELEEFMLIPLTLTRRL